MDISRAERIANVMKTTSQLGKNIKIPSSPLKMPTILGQAGPSRFIEGTGVLKIMMYVVAGLLLIGLILLGVDQWITPIFQRTPGGNGYIPIPGTDLSQEYWKTSATVANIMIGTPSSPQATSGAPVVPPLSTTVLEGQSNYSITMDIFIKDESPQVLGIEDRRIFFMLGQTPTTPTLIAWIANDKNTAYVTGINADGLQESAAIDNVPIHKPFRIGIVKSPLTLEVYLNGKLVMTRQQRSIDKIPTTGDVIYSPANIIVNGKVLSQNIKVMNLRVFGYSVSPSEMLGRMGDLVTVDTFNPPTK